MKETRQKKHLVGSHLCEMSRVANLFGLVAARGQAEERTGSVCYQVACFWGTEKLRPKMSQNYDAVVVQPCALDEKHHTLQMCELYSTRIYLNKAVKKPLQQISYRV